MQQTKQPPRGGGWGVVRLFQCTHSAAETDLYRGKVEISKQLV